MIRSALTLALVLLACWLVPHTWRERRLFYRDFAYTATEARDLGRFPVALQAYGLEAWSRLDLEAATGYFRAAADRDPLFIDAWLELAEAEAASGRAESARRVLAFTHGLTAPVMRWKWPQTLLAHELDDEAVLRHNVDFLAARGRKLADVFNLVDTRYGGDPAPVLAFLAPAGWPAYLEWLMRWQRTAAASVVWGALEASGGANPEMLLKYADFLLRTKKTAAAAEVWRRHTGTTGMTNPGFEAESSGTGFDWRLARDVAEHWQLRRVAGEGREGSHALRLNFSGRENLDFHHARQIVPVTPGEAVRLRWWWRAKGLSTDRGPCVEVSGYDAPGLNLRSPMLLGTSDWREEHLDFNPPPGCRAVVVRLRRLPSRRFDSKIAGTLWVDDFALEEAPPGAPPALGVRREERAAGAAPGGRMHGAGRAPVDS
jgi:hypothetical protein